MNHSGRIMALGLTQSLPETGSIQSCNGVDLPFYLLQPLAKIRSEFLRR